MKNWWKIEEKLMKNWWKIDEKLTKNWWKIDEKFYSFKILILKEQYYSVVYEWKTC